MSPAHRGARNPVFRSRSVVVAPGRSRTAVITLGITGIKIGVLGGVNGLHRLLMRVGPGLYLSQFGAMFFSFTAVRGQSVRGLAHLVKTLYVLLG